MPQNGFSCPAIPRGTGRQFSDASLQERRHTSDIRLVTGDDLSDMMMILL
jgi:hypothetical protein